MDILARSASLLLWLNLSYLPMEFICFFLFAFAYTIVHFIECINIPCENLIDQAEITTTRNLFAHSLILILRSKSKCVFKIRPNHSFHNLFLDSAELYSPIVSVHLISNMLMTAGAIFHVDFVKQCITALKKFAIRGYFVSFFDISTTPVKIEKMHIRVLVPMFWANQ